MDCDEQVVYKTKQGTVKVPIISERPPHLVGTPAQRMVIQGDGPNYHLLFYQVIEPVIAGKSRRKRWKALKKIKAVRSVCVADVAVSAGDLRAMMRVAKRHVDKYSPPGQD